MQRCSLFDIRFVFKVTLINALLNIQRTVLNRLSKLYGINQNERNRNNYKFYRRNFYVCPLFCTNVRTALASNYWTSFGKCLNNDIWKLFWILFKTRIKRISFLYADNKLIDLCYSDEKSFLYWVFVVFY